MKLQKNSPYGINFACLAGRRDIPQGKNKFFQGFSLVEMIIAIFVFSLIIMTAVAVFANIVSVHKKTRTIQSDMESARTALDLMAKNIREATYLEGVGSAPFSEIKMKNGAQGRCVYYRFSGSNLEIGYGSSATPCLGILATPYVSIIEGNVTNGLFDVDLTSATPPKAIGKVTARMEIGGKTMQTTASFRDYAGIIE